MKTNNKVTTILGAVSGVAGVLSQTPGLDKYSSILSVVSSLSLVGLGYYTNNIPGIVKAAKSLPDMSQVKMPDRRGDNY